MIIYVVFDYWVDDVILNGLFSTREKAEEYIKKTKGDKGIEEYILDETIIEIE